MFVDGLGIHLGPLYLRFYGLILVCGAMLAAYLVGLEASRRNLDPNFAWDALLWCLVGGIIGARLYHVLTPSPSNLLADGSNPYFHNPMRILYVWEGGLGIPGGVAGGALALWIFARQQAQSFVVWGDLAVAGLLLAQGIGRWGNYVNQELYGAPSQLPWAISISPQYRLPAYAAFETFHPLFLYESILNIAGAFLLLWLSRNWKRAAQGGSLIGAYLLIYPAIRFALEFIRLDSSHIGSLNANQWLAAITFVVAAAVLAARSRQAIALPVR